MYVKYSVRELSNVNHVFVYRTIFLVFLTLDNKLSQILRCPEQ